MLKHGEHTWGAAGNSVDNIHWTNDEFHKLNTPGKKDIVLIYIRNKYLLL